MERITGGPGVRAAQIGDQTVLSAIQARRGFRGAWWCSRVGTDEIRIAQGFVNGVEPFIGNRRLSGRNEKNEADPAGPPLLKLDTAKYDARSISRICLAVRVNDTGKMPAKPGPGDVYLLQHPTGVSSDPLVGMVALALLWRRPGTGNSDFGVLRQIAYFDLQHMVRKREAGRYQHFFVPSA